MDKSIKGLKSENKIIEESTVSNEMEMLAFLQEKQNIKSKEIWCKIDKTQKIQKVNIFIDEVFGPENNLNEMQCQKCKEYLQDIIDKKRLNKNKDVVYKDEKIISITNFSYSKTSNKPQLSCEKRASTLRLPDLKKLNKKHNKTKSDNDTNNGDGKKIKIRDSVE